MKAKILDIFKKRLDDIKADCTSVGDGIRGTDQLRWMFSKLNSEDTAPDNFDFSGLEAIFDRSEADNIYEEALADKDNSNRQDLAITKLQSNILSGMERDYRMRKRSRIRRLAHESTSKSWVGSPHGPIESGMLFVLQEQLTRISTKK